MIGNITEIKQLLHIDTDTYDTLLTNLLTSANDTIKRYCNREFEQADYTSYFDGDGVTTVFMLEDAPINSITSVYIDDNELSTDDYEIYATEGIIKLSYPPSNSDKLLKVVYNAGYAESDIPGAVKLAVENLVVVWFNSIKGAGILTERIGHYSVTFTALRPKLRDLVYNLLKPYVLEQDPHLLILKRVTDDKELL